MDQDRSECFALATCAQDFVQNALPLGKTASKVALSAFIAVVPRFRVPALVLEALLLRLLGIFECQSGGRVPTLIEEYLLLESRVPDRCQRFGQCINNLLTYRGVKHKSVQQAIAVIHESYFNARLEQRQVANRLRLGAPYLAALFKRHTGITFREYLREVRMAHAARMLVSTNKSIKEIWIAVGYNHASDFDHHFKHHFATTPSEYRSRGSGTAQDAKLVSVLENGNEHAVSGIKVLLVDDDQGTRDIFREQLQRQGYSVMVACSGQEGLSTLNQWNPRVLVIDYHLPDLLGIDVLRRVRGGLNSGRLIAIVLSADWHLEELSLELKELNATILLKPCDVDRLSAAIAMSLGLARPV